MSELRTNKILPRDGLPAGSFGGGIVQVRFAALDSSTSISATTADLFTLNITPTSASNKILLDLRVRCQTHYSSSGEIQIHHSFTDLYTPSVAITSTIAFQPYWRSWNGGEVSFNVSDSNSYGEVVMTVMEVSA